MATISPFSYGFILCFVALFCYSDLCFGWSPAGATWYGSPNGAGSDGGSCAYGGAVSQSPYSSFITAVGPSLYGGGQQCGACYQVRCTTHPSCSGNPVRVVITDSCPGCPGGDHFDLSGTSFGAMAIPGQANNLRNAGVLDISFQRVACDYGTRKIAFHVDSGSNPYYFSTVVMFQEGDGDLGSVAVREVSGQWRQMQHLWGANWKLDAGAPMNPPFLIRLTSRTSGQTLVAQNVIPVAWRPGATYTSTVNFL